MDMNDFDRFQALLFLLAYNFRDEIFKMKKTTEISYRFRLLSDYEMKEIERAARIIISRRIFMKMPTIGEIIENIDEDDTDCPISESAFNEAIRVFEIQIKDNGCDLE